MSRQLRYRVTAIVLGGLIFGAPMLTNGTASAEQTGAGGRQVTFEGGGMLGLSCRSRPDVESMVVPAESTIRVVNRTGHNANLQLGGETKGMLPDDAATEVVFRRGTTAVLLKPTCALGDEAVPVLVTAAPSASAAMPDPIPVPSGGNPATSAGASSGSGAPSGAVAGSTLPDTVPSSGRPARVPSATSHSSTRGPGSRRTGTVTQAATTAEQAMPPGGAATRIKASRTSPGTTGSAVPAFAGMPPGDEKEVLPGVPRMGAASVGSDAQLPSVSAPTAAAAAEPVAAMAPIRETGPIGLLALTAAVCVMGVGAAAIRAIVSQRANRSRMA